MFSVSENITIRAWSTMNLTSVTPLAAGRRTSGGVFVVIFSKTESLISSYAKVATCV